MARKETHREPCPERHALAIARWEDNQAGWLEGEFFGLTSNRRDLQQLVGDGGTLWIVVSRGRTGGGRLYSVSFRLENCRSHTYSRPKKGKVAKGKVGLGPFAVIGDKDRSTLFAANDARYLLLSLRFDPYRPIQNPDRIGQAIQTPRCLNESDISLLEGYGAEVAKWSVFLSYRRADQTFAMRLADRLRALGLDVFVDQQALRGGSRWRKEIYQAIERARHMVVLLGPETHESEEVRGELEHAFDCGTPVIPVLVGGRLEDWKDMPRLHALHALKGKRKAWATMAKAIAGSIGVRELAGPT
jgi:hypothetical protein